MKKSVAQRAVHEAGPPWNEAERLSSLRAYGILDTPPEPVFDEITRVAALICKAPIAVINLIEDKRQFFKAEIGLGVRETPVDVSICAHAILQQDLLVVPDTTRDSRFACNPLVTGEPHLRFYAGAVLGTPDGLPIGTVCVLDYQPRPEGISDEQRETLRALARAVMAHLELRRSQRTLEDSEQRFRAIADTMPQIVWSNRPDGYHDYFNRRWYEFTGATPDESAGAGWNPKLHPEDRERAFATWRRALATGEPYEIEYRLQGRDGSYRWFIGRAVPLRNERGEIERWFGTCTDVNDLKRSEEGRELLARELSHRIKNIFALVGGLAGLSARAHPEASGFVASFRDRLDALARAHNFVQPHGPENAATFAGQTVQGLIRVLLSPYRQEGRERIAASGDDAPVGSTAATALALIIHEQATNAVKYGALSSETGHVTLKGSREGDQFVLVWQERGGPEVSGPPERQGFGTQMASRSLAGQLGGTLHQDWAREGLTIRLVVPLEKLER